MNVLEIRLLGAPTVHWGGAPLSIVRRQTRMLLFRLAMFGQPLLRERLCFLFWPDVPEAVAGRNLSHLLTHLRQALPADDILCTFDDRVYLNPDAAWSDVEEFRRLSDSAGADRDLNALTQIPLPGPFLDGLSAPHCPEYEPMLLSGGFWSGAIARRCPPDRQRLSGE